MTKQINMFKKEDYKPYPWYVKNVFLHFILGEEYTTVRSKLEIEINES